ncbi:OFA family MFS transporter [Mycolicibacterium flavescens]|uniref:MFS transporter n=1 Tax=Mycolicibacterium flavescens TaxID=1776 RepID=A0A1E3RRE7_MYCFV|nr:OFA family MFS transporter [Mycolicibacterium flavescens]MCV7279813.1 OFA family MFS transporter [Mycolicibacterium flavescens]ODQ92439.1 MFS transporter [Mycolicibacterium flavescens]
MTAATKPPFFSRDRIIASPGWSRWLVPPAALSIHLSIGAAYSWSVFKNPLEGALGISGTLSALPFTVGIVVLGVSAAIFGTWVDRNGPRAAMFVAMCCFCGGWLIGSAGLAIGQYWRLVLLGYGLVGGIGWGIGYISPVSTLIKWFPDRPGMATGLAIMGFGGGALIASPWSTAMLDVFGTESSGIAKTFLVHGLAYAVFMSLGWLLVRVPRSDWKPHGWTPPAPSEADSIVTGGQVSANNAVKTPQFWLLWVVLCFNVTAGIGILEKASPIYQDFFPAAGAAATALAAAAAGYVALLSLSNMLGRIGWSSLSDKIGRKNAYRMYLGVGALLYLTITLMENSNKVVFLVSTMLILSFYGAGFATVPAYLRDLFGTYQVGAIHGRLLTAWSAAGILGPILVNAVADSQEAAGKSGPGLYTMSFSIMIGLLVVGFVCNELIRPVNDKWHEAADVKDQLQEAKR